MTVSFIPAHSRSPLQYPGGKSRAVPEIVSRLPAGLDELCSPFLGGASVELACGAMGMLVHGSDAFGPLVNFWRELLDSPAELARRAALLHPMSREEFYRLQRGYSEEGDPAENAAVFYALNRSSFSGFTLSGGMSPGHKRFTPSSIERAQMFRAPNLRAERLDWREALARHSSKFLYLDPPYANGERLYGRRGDMHCGFNHEELAAELRGRGGWLLSYNDCELVRRLYKGFRFEEPEWKYGMGGRRSREVLVLGE